MPCGFPKRSAQHNDGDNGDPDIEDAYTEMSWGDEPTPDFQIAPLIHPIAVNKIKVLVVDCYVLVVSYQPCS